MKIAHIAPPWIAIPPKNYGGTEIVISNLVEEQVAQGYDVTLFAPGDAKTSAKLVSFFPKSLIDSGVPWSAHLRAYYHVQKSLEYAKEFDIVHTHLSSSSDLYIFPLTAGLTTPHVTTLHSRVHHGLPMHQFQPTGRKRGDFFVWLGRFVPEKGTHLAIEAAKRARVPLVLAGTIDRYQQESIHYFEQMIKPHIDNEQVKYVGPVNMKQKISLLSRAWGFLNPIEWEEPFGMVMIEAMALGCPVISFARGAAPELIVHGKTGFLVHDVNEMVRFIPRIDDIDRHVTRMHVERRFSVRIMAQKYVKIYQKVIAQANTASARTSSLAAAQALLTAPLPSLIAK